MVKEPFNPPATTRLERRAGMLAEMSLAHYCGTVTAISGETVRIAGLSGIASMGDQISLSHAPHTADGEIIAAVNGATPDELPSFAALVVKP